MANFYNVIGATTNTDFISKLKDGLVLAGFAVEELSADTLKVTVNTNKIFTINCGTDFIIRVVARENDGTTAAFENDYIYGNVFSYVGFSEMHLIGYDAPQSLFCAVKRADGLWVQLFFGYLEQQGNQPAFAASVSSVAADSHVSEYVDSMWYYKAGGSPFVNQPLFCGVLYYRYASTFINVDAGDGSAHNWHIMRETKTNGVVACDIATTYYWGDVYSYQAANMGWHRLKAAKQNFGWNTNLVSIPFLYCEDTGFQVPIGLAPHMRAVRSGEHTELDKITSGNIDYWLFPWYIARPYQDGRVSSVDYFWALEILPGQESPVFL